MASKLLPAIGLVFLALLAVPASIEAADCGGDGQRACCNGCFELSNVGTACNGGTFIFNSGTSRACGGTACTIIGATTKDICVAPKACGGPGQRACCLLEGGRTQSCNAGLVEGPGCSVGDPNCLCSSGAYAVGVCTAPTCGGNGQRGCCTGERSAKGLSGPCGFGSIELGSCSSELGSGSCHCLQPSGSDSLGVCRATQCGGPGQRGCCVGAERTVNGINGPCQGGLVEFGTCTGSDCACQSPAGSSSSGRCIAPTACGGEGQRACQIGEGAACQPGLVETGSSLADLFGFSSASCSQQLGAEACLGASGALSTGVCRRVQCGKDGERGCCIGSEREARGIAGPCLAGNIEDTSAGCTGGNCACTGLGAVGSSIGVCKAVTACGGKDQRACCFGLETTPNPGIPPAESLACTAGNIEIAGCTGACLCGGTGIGQKSSSTCRENTRPTPCGGAGQRACCAGTFEVLAGNACRDGNVEVPGCGPDDPAGSAPGDSQCKCGGFNPFNIKASSTCVPTTACGGPGQRACCVGAGEYATGLASCNAGLTEIPGCSGDCTCNGPLTLGSGAVSSGTCTQLVGGRVKQIPEPGPGWTEPQEGPVCRMRGYADMHLHLFAELAHGGGVLAGKAWDAGGINEALKQDYGTNNDLVSKTNVSTGTTQEVPAPNCPSWIPDCGAKKWHGGHGLDDIVGTASGDGTNSNLGVPVFNGWPRWSNVTHQQAYYKWLERAWRGGLRLTSMLAVTNEALCLGNKKLRDTDCDNSMKPLDEQIQAAKNFQAWLDAQSGGPGRGWFQIVTSPSDARKVIGQGKLAVILGIEVDNLFNCKANGIKSWAWESSSKTWVRPNTPPYYLADHCDATYVREEIKRYKDMGVIHVFPIHNFDNGYGATATWFDSINVGNYVSEGAYYAPEDCAAEGYGFKLSSFLAGIIGSLGFSGLPEPPDYGSFAATCNSKTLTALGETLILEMMKNGMIIDLDHMGNKAIDRTLTLAEEYRPAGSSENACSSDFECVIRGGQDNTCCSSGPRAGQCVATLDACNVSTAGYPIIASHIIPFDLTRQANRTERMRTDAQLLRIKNLGGMVAPITEMRELADITNEKLSVQYGTVANDCSKSTKTFAQVFEKTVDVMEGPVGLGTDWNGTAFHLSPRFGNEACAGIAAERSAQYRFGSRVQYPFTLDAFGTFGKQVTGDKTYDYNVDGLAHVGLMPDFIKDLEVVGLPPAKLEQLWRSAEGFIDMWDRINGGSPPPVLGGTGGQCTGLRDPNQGFAQIPVDDQCRVTNPALIERLAADGRLAVTIAPPGPFDFRGYVLSQQTTCVSVSATANDACSASGGQSSFCNGCFVPVDKTAPRLTCPADVTAEQSGDLTFPSIPTPTGLDNCAELGSTDYGLFSGAGFFGCNRNPAAGFPAGATTVTCTAHDGQGNQSSCSYTVTIVAPPQPVGQTIDFGPLADRTYGDGPLTLTATASSELAVGFSLVSGPALLSGNTLFINGAGTVVIKASQPGNGSYLAALDVVRSFEVFKASTIITLGGLVHTYDGTPKAAFASVGIASGVVTITYDGSTLAPTNAGSYLVVASLTDANYQAPDVVGTLVIGARAITVAADPQSKTYGDPDPPLTYSVISGSLAASTDGFVGALTRDTGEGVGAHAIRQGSLALSTNYALTFTGADLTIGARAITVAADAQSKPYGDPDPALTYSVTSGHLAFPGDGFSGALTRVAGEDVGSYAVQQGTLALSGNYALAFVGADLTIGAKTVTVTAAAQSKTYGDADPPLTFTHTSLAFSDAFTGGLARTPGENVGSYPITQGSLALSPNYAIHYAGADLAILVRALTITANDRSKTYGDTVVFAGTEFSAAGLAFSDAVHGVALSSAGAPAGASVGSYPIVATAAVGSGLTNYATSYVDGRLTVGKATPFLAWTGAVSGIYNQPAALAASVAFGPASGMAGTPIPGKPVTLAVGAQSCASVTQPPSGTATCTVTVNQSQGPYPALATFAGDVNFMPGSAGATFTVSPGTAGVVYTGTRLIANGQPFTVSARVTDTFTNTPVAGLDVAFSLGSQACSATTDVDGRATCVLSAVSQPLGPASITTRFAGDAHYLAASDTTPVLVFAYAPAGGSFAIAVSKAGLGTTVTFWSSQWARANLPSAPSSFKGFATTPALPACGAGFVTSTGASSNPPATVPEYMAVIATASVSQSGPVLSGDSPKIVIVKTAPGYGPDPAREGTGIVVAVLCGGLPGER